MSILAGSHLVVATHNVAFMREWFEWLFEIKPHFTHEEFCEFVLPSRFRIAFFLPTGKSSMYFEASEARKATSVGLTVADVNLVYERALSKEKAYKFRFSGPPKDHPWGERSFLLIDGDDNRWELTQTPSKDGMLVDRDS